MKYKTLAMLGALLLITAAPRALAQQFSCQHLLNQNGTNAVGINLTNSWPLNGSSTNTIALTKHDSVGIAIKFEPMASSTHLAEFVFRHSLLGTTNYATVNPIRISIPADGTTPVCFVTNITVAAMGFLALDRITNGAVAITNLVIEYSLKPKRNG